MFYCQALQVLLLWGHLVQTGHSTSPGCRMEPFSLAKVPIRAGNKNTSHSSAEILRGFGILSPESKGGDWTSTNSKALLKKISVSFVQIPSELLQGWGTGKVPRQQTPTSNKTQYVNDWKINYLANKNVILWLQGSWHFPGYLLQARKKRHKYVWHQKWQQKCLFILPSTN